MYTNKTQVPIYKFAPVQQPELQGRVDTLNSLGLGDSFLGDAARAHLGLIKMRDQARTDLQDGIGNALSGAINKFRGSPAPQSDAVTGEGLGLKSKLSSL